MARALATLLGEPSYLADAQLESRAERSLAAFFHRNPHTSSLTTDRLVCLIEEHAEDLDVYADLAHHGPDIEGLTLYELGHRPRVKIANRLAEAPNDRRFRTTLAHELGHVLAHGPMFDEKIAQQPLLGGEQAVHACSRQGIEDPNSDFRLEWQAWALGMAILMPGSRVRPLINTCAEDAGQFAAVHYDTDLGRLMCSCTAETFGVSHQAAQIRLFRLKCLVKEPPEPSLFD